MSSNASRLATRWLNRQSSQLDAPPAMVKAITEWATDEYLSRAMYFLPPKPTRDLTDYDTVKKFVAHPTKETWDTMVQSVGDRNLRDRSWQLADPSKWKGLAFKNFLRAMQAALDERQASLIKANESRKHRWDRIHELLSDPSTKPVTDREDLLKSALMTFPMNLSGWKYAGKMPKGVVLSPVKVSIQELIQGAGAAWEAGSWTLYLPLISENSLRDLRILYDFLKNDLRDSVYHECQHMAQSLLKQALPAESHGKGMPSEKIMTPEWKQHTRPTQQLDTRTFHSMDDIEFYPVLQSAIFKGHRGVLRNPAAQRRILVQEVTLGQWKGADYDLEYATGFFRALKKHAPGKYRKAVSEFISAVL